MKHTAEKWTVQDVRKESTANIEVKTGNLLSVKAGDTIIAICGLKSNKKVKVNAKLIAAAPELLAVCQMALESAIDGSYISGSRWWGLMKDAVKKATV